MIIWVSGVFSFMVEINLTPSSSGKLYQEKSKNLKIKLAQIKSLSV